MLVVQKRWDQCVRDEEQSGCLYLVMGDLKQKVNAEFGKTGSSQFLNYRTPPPPLPLF